MFDRLAGLVLRKPRAVLLVALLLALVAGGASGLGEATARHLAREGAAVTIADLNAEKGEALADEIGASFVAADVTNPEQVEAAAERVERELGPIDVWVNDAIAVIFSPFKDIELDDFKRSTEVCYLGTV